MHACKACSRYARTPQNTVLAEPACAKQDAHGMAGRHPGTVSERDVQQSSESLTHALSSEDAMSLTDGLQLDSLGAFLRRHAPDAEPLLMFCLDANRYLRHVAKVDDGVDRGAAKLHRMEEAIVKTYLVAGASSALQPLLPAAKAWQPQFQPKEYSDSDHDDCSDDNEHKASKSVAGSAGAGAGWLRKMRHDATSALLGQHLRGYVGSEEWHQHKHKLIELEHDASDLAATWDELDTNNVGRAVSTDFGENSDGMESRCCVDELDLTHNDAVLERSQLNCSSTTRTNGAGADDSDDDDVHFADPEQLAWGVGNIVDSDGTASSISGAVQTSSSSASRSARISVHGRPAQTAAALGSLPGAMSGWLNKRGSGLGLSRRIRGLSNTAGNIGQGLGERFQLGRSYQRRWFVVCPTTLLYWFSSPDAQTPKGVLDLAYYNVCEADSAGNGELDGEVGGESIARMQRFRLRSTCGPGGHAWPRGYRPRTFHFAAAESSSTQCRQNNGSDAKKTENGEWSAATWMQALSSMRTNAVLDQQQALHALRIDLDAELQNARAARDKALDTAASCDRERSSAAARMRGQMLQRLGQIAHITATVQEASVADATLLDKIAASGVNLPAQALENPQLRAGLNAHLAKGVEKAGEGDEWDRMEQDLHSLAESVRNHAAASRHMHAVVEYLVHTQQQTQKCKDEAVKRAEEESRRASQVEVEHRLQEYELGAAQERATEAQLRATDAEQSAADSMQRAEQAEAIARKARQETARALERAKQAEDELARARSEAGQAQNALFLAKAEVHNVVEPRSRHLKTSEAGRNDHMIVNGGTTLSAPAPSLASKAITSASAFMSRVRDQAQNPSRNGTQASEGVIHEYLATGAGVDGASLRVQHDQLQPEQKQKSLRIPAPQLASVAHGGLLHGLLCNSSNRPLPSARTISTAVRGTCNACAVSRRRVGHANTSKNMQEEIDVEVIFSAGPLYMDLFPRSGGDLPDRSTGAVLHALRRPRPQSKGCSTCPCLGPAEAAGLRPGAVLVAIAGAPVGVSMPFDDVVRAARCRPLALTFRQPLMPCADSNCNSTGNDGVALGTSNLIAPEARRVTSFRLQGEVALLGPSSPEQTGTAEAYDARNPATAIPPPPAPTHQQSTASPTSLGARMRRALGSSGGASKAHNSSKSNLKHLKHKPKAKLHLGQEGEDDDERCDDVKEMHQQRMHCSEQQQRQSVLHVKLEKQHVEEQQQPGGNVAGVPRFGSKSIARPGLGRVANKFLSLASGVATGAAASQASRR